MANSFLGGVIGDGQIATHRAFDPAWTADGINDYLAYENSAQVNNLFALLSQATRFTISAWVNMGVTTGLQSTWFNVNSTSRSLVSGFWNNSTPYSVIFGGISSNTGRVGYQTIRGGDIISDFADLTNVNNASRLVHFAWVNAGEGPERFRLYINGRLWSKNVTLATVANFIGTTNAFVTLCLYSYNSPALNFVPMKLTDFMIATAAATDSEVRKIYNNGTNIVANYASRYPARLLSNRWVHLPLSLGNFSVSGGNLLATDISGNLRDFRVFGQATTPTTTPVY